jgi:RNA polymerase sigma factor (sigma-70 family)
MRRELSPLQKQVLEGIYYENLSQAELARRMGVNRSTVCRTLHRAQDRLKRFLSY